LKNLFIFSQSNNVWVVHIDPSKSIDVDIKKIRPQNISLHTTDFDVLCKWPWLICLTVHMWVIFFLVAQVGLATSEFRNFPPKNVKFFNFFPSGQKKSNRVDSKKYPDQSRVGPVYTIDQKHARVGLGQGPSLICPLWRWFIISTQVVHFRCKKMNEFVCYKLFVCDLLAAIKIVPI